jgi:hypothetical protein
MQRMGPSRNGVTKCVSRLLSGASVYRLGNFGTARKELKALTLSPRLAGAKSDHRRNLAYANVYERP